MRAAPASCPTGRSRATISSGRFPTRATRRNNERSSLAGQVPNLQAPALRRCRALVRHQPLRRPTDNKKPIAPPRERASGDPRRRVRIQSSATGALERLVDEISAFSPQPARAPWPRKPFARGYQAPVFVRAFRRRRDSFNCARHSPTAHRPGPAGRTHSRATPSTSLRQNQQGQAGQRRGKRASSAFIP
jgi:hypothetical protein